MLRCAHALYAAREWFRARASFPPAPVPSVPERSGGLADMEADLSNIVNAHVLNVKRLSDHAFLPTRGSAHAAGYDLYRCVEVLLCVY